MTAKTLQNSSLSNNMSIKKNKQTTKTVVNLLSEVCPLISGAVSSSEVDVDMFEFNCVSLAPKPDSVTL